MKYVQRFVVVGMSALVMACGSGGSGSGAGGGDGDGSTPQPSDGLNPPVDTALVINEFTAVSGASPQAIQLSWEVSDSDLVSSYRLLVSRSGDSDFVVVNGADSLPGLTQGFNLNVPGYLPSWLNARYQLEALAADSSLLATQVLTYRHDPEVPLADLSSITYLKSSNPDKEDDFGTAIALSGDGKTLVVGAPSEDGSLAANGTTEDDNNLHSSGAAYVFSKVEAGWQQVAYLKAYDSEFFHRFGQAVAISADGSTIAVGSGKYGSVYTFTLNNNRWQRQGDAISLVSSSGVDFSRELALSSDGKIMAIGAPSNDSAASGGDEPNPELRNSGAVYIYEYANKAWQQQAFIKASNAGVEDFFGAAISLSADGNQLVVGAPSEDSDGRGVQGEQNNNNSTNSGAVYAFTRSGSDWLQSAYIKPSDDNDDAHFGDALAISGDGSMMVVGAPFKQAVDDNSGFLVDFGGAYIFVQQDGQWRQQAFVRSDNIDALDRFGAAVSTDYSGSVIAISAPSENSVTSGIDGDSGNTAGSGAGFGASYVFMRNGDQWLQQSYVKAANTGSQDRFGHVIKLSGDGSTLAVSAPSEDGSASGVNGTANDATVDAGAVYLY